MVIGPVRQGAFIEIHGQGQVLDPAPFIRRQNTFGPKDCSPRVVVEKNRLDHAGAGLVVVAADDYSVDFSEGFDGLLGCGSIADHVSQAQNAVNPNNCNIL